VTRGWELLKLALLMKGLYCRAMALVSYNITEHGFMCLLSGGEKVFLTCVSVGRGLFLSAVLTDRVFYRFLLPTLES